MLKGDDVVTCVQVEYRPFTVSDRLPVSAADWRRKEGGLLSKVLRNQAPKACLKVVLTGNDVVTCVQVEYRPFTVSDRLPVSAADWRRKEGGLLSKVLRNQAKPMHKAITASLLTTAGMSGGDGG